MGAVTCLESKLWMTWRFRLKRVGIYESAARSNVRRLSGLRQRIPSQGWRTIEFRKDPTAAQATPISATNLHCHDERTTPALADWLIQSFLPKGYPESVRSTYMTYVQWTALGLLSGRLQSVLATQAALFAVGLGAGSIPMAAAVQWILKDGVGSAAGVVYATRVNNRFDADAKRYRFHSTVGCTVADFVAVFMPLYPQYFLILASASSGLSSMANVAQLASRARVQASFALQGNLADVARSGQTQAKLMSLLGTALGAGLSWIVGPHPFSVAACMVPLACISLYSTYVSSCIVVLQSFNVQRAELVFKRMIEGMQSQMQVKPLAPSPSEIAEVETFCFGHRSVFRHKLLLQPLIGQTSVAAAFLPMSSTTHVELAAVLPLFATQASSEWSGDSAWTAAWHADFLYAVAFQRRCHISQGNDKHEGSPVVIWHRSKATARAKLQAMWHACVVRYALDADTDVGFDGLHEFARGAWPDVLSALEEAGWDTDRVFLDGAGGFLEPQTE